ncbi:MAG: tetratricopeptide repeat protein [Planctomycetaceae bacterium]|nr:tetratricopeptide repeat protein [Planctomycetaceae bacterium]
MSGKTALVIVVSALFLGASAQSGEQAALPCPPGAKFCPLPGSNNQAFMQNYFAMDAKTGQVTTVSSIESQAVDNSHLDTGEVLLMVAPNGNYDNVYVPPSQVAGGVAAPVMQPSVSVPAQAMQPAPAMAMPMPQQWAPFYQPLPPARPISAATAPASDTHSEVANQAVQRTRQPLQADERVPWWKGGLWRNRGDDGQDNGDDDSRNGTGNNDNDNASANARRNARGRAARSARDEDTRDNDTASARSNTRSNDNARSLGRAPRMLDDDEMWENDDYTGYNADGSFGRSAAQASANRRPPNPPAPPQPQANPYGPAPQGYPAPGPQQPYPQPGYANAPMYNPGAPMAAPGQPYGYPAQPTYSANPYDTVPTIVLNSGAVASDPYAATYAGSTGYPAPGPVYSDPYATGTAGIYTDPTGLGGYTASSSVDSTAWPLAPIDTTPNYQASPSIDAQGSPQFENAVRLVKDNRFSEAKAILVSETGRNPSNAAAWRWLADCHYNLLELDEAITSYQRALERDPNDYYALRGQGFSYLHRGHEHWRRMQEEVGRGEKETAAATFAQAHENYKRSLEMLGLCLRRAPNDGEAVYGEAMAAEGASRKLYSNAISYLKLGPEQRERAELFAENCMTVINKGIERSNERAKQVPGDAGPRALLGGLYLRKAILYHQLGKNDLALIELRNSRDVQNSILDEIDKNNETAKRNIQETEVYWEAWGGNVQ